MYAQEYTSFKMANSKSEKGYHGDYLRKNVVPPKSYTSNMDVFEEMILKRN